MKKIGFLSFGHYRDVPGARVRTAADSLRQHVELAVAAEEVGMDGAWLRVHHFEESHAAPFPLLSAMAARTSTIDVGTGVVDLRYENPLYLAEEAGATDLLSDGRLQLGVSRGSPENAVDGQHAFGYHLGNGETWSDVAQQRVALFQRAIAGERVAHSASAQRFGHAPDLSIRPLSPGLGERVWWGAGRASTADWVAQQGMNLLSSTLLLAQDGRPFHVQQADQLSRYRQARRSAGMRTDGLTAVTRSVFPITTDEDRRYFAGAGGAGDVVGQLDGTEARFGPVFAGDPEEVATQLAADDAVGAADYVLFALPSQLGVAYNTHLFENLVALGRELGWKR